ncbi:hypothetical protein COEREDRAFT_81819 [Coemansia reversa NRRL 1564]|uniref:Uncharacterized protein n=1 Tax=Coemansia reversa (strain ATCC 12441 / NRRL 1564) TaxID=763665 RepID=A0A2G5B9J1_COERN|nr:hypothetical protein COEREDRAFT_81819 [Coemansia reversa NRRL 1564]|eukprot:PIA15686.1 hypothetical protein COEREDRAFT_81819 [Coemansia reversa NRRL 1564]
MWTKAEVRTNRTHGCVLIQTLSHAQSHGCKTSLKGDFTPYRVLVASVLPSGRLSEYVRSWILRYVV